MEADGDPRSSSHRRCRTHLEKRRQKRLTDSRSMWKSLFVTSEKASRFISAWRCWENVTICKRTRRNRIKINREKTETMAAEEAHILLDGKPIEQVPSFIYLGQAIQLERPIGRRISSEWYAFKKYGPFLTSASVQMKWKRRIFNQCILPAMLYGCEAWATTEEARKKLAVAQRRMERRMARVRLINRRSNAWLRGVTKLKDVTETAARRKWSFAWKMTNANIEKPAVSVTSRDRRLCQEARNQELVTKRTTRSPLLMV
ncbi:hypothetical protein L596_012136 [Steinernema carpocapsae]|uniref:Reverse transcriptase domain-containing protein n=1 Tax=Steinernema carpocapsae TaxID=34508 RepID=A0A4U5NW49_STECR|nr:hypothetical protein L596_012136 [Steinernema carpocapsae]